MKDSRFDHEGACGHFTVHSRLGLHLSKHQLINASSLELGKESLQYRLNVAQEESRSERVTLLDPDVILDDDRIAIVIWSCSSHDSFGTYRRKCTGAPYVR